MKVAAAKILEPRKVNAIGAFVASNVLLDGLVAAGHDVVYQDTPDGCDVAVSNYGDTGNLHRAAVAAGVPSVRLMHSPPKGAPIGLQGAALAVANSEATARMFIWPGRTVVIHPPTFPDAHRTTPGTRVTLVNLSAGKGSQLFWRLARRMSDVEFLAVRGGHGVQVVPAAVPENVSVWEPQPDMRTVWAQTRVLLMPSKRESWGMVGIEAMCSGIPVVASPVRGLRESLGDAGVFVKPEDRKAWDRTIRELVADEAVWRRASKKALRRVGKLDPAKSVARFVAEIEAM